MTNIKHICTYFDFNFLPKGLALYHSIKRQNSEFNFYVLALDHNTYNYLINLHYYDLIPISFESYNEYFNLSPDKYLDRKQYYFSVTPNICLHIFKVFPGVDTLLYLDADVYVTNSLNPIYEEVGDASIAFCSHRFNPFYKFFTKNYGRYNVGVNFFRKSEIGLNCLLDWKSDCDGWFPGKPGYPLDFFSDQIFLDEWPKKYKDLKIIMNIGVNTAPWNIANYKIEFKQDSYWVNDNPLIIYHFSSLRKIDINKWDCNTVPYFTSISGTLKKLYKDYITEIESFGLRNDAVTKLTKKRNKIKMACRYLVNIFIKETIEI